MQGSAVSVADTCARGASVQNLARAATEPADSQSVSQQAERPETYWCRFPPDAGKLRMLDEKKVCAATKADGGKPSRACCSRCPDQKSFFQPGRSAAFCSALVLSGRGSPSQWQRLLI